MFDLKRSICPLLVLATLASTGAAQATTYYVATTGNDGYSCAAAQNPSTPKATIPAGVICLAGGDTLIIKAGTYTITGVGTAFITNPPSGTASDYTTIMADPAGARPVLQGATPVGTQAQKGVILKTESSRRYIEIRGLEIKTVYQAIYFCGPECAGVTTMNDHIRVVDCYIHDTFGPAVIMTHNSTSVQAHEFRGNEFSRVGSQQNGYKPGTPTFYNTGNETIIENNVFHDSTHGIDICGGGSCGGNKPTTGGSVIVRNNVFYNMGRFDLNPWAAGAGFSTAILANASRDHQFYNNIIYNSGFTGVTGPGGTSNAGIFAGIALQISANNSHVYNNTIYNLLDSTAEAVFVSVSGVNVKNNIAYLAGNGIVGSGSFSNNRTTDPSFVNADAANFHLQSGSVAIDAGVTVPGVTVDYEGTPRPQGGAYDIGAYEGAGSDTVVPTAPKNLSVR
jgi:hypothetical protein